jgi:peroxiredoxin
MKRISSKAAGRVEPRTIAGAASAAALLASTLVGFAMWQRAVCAAQSGKRPAASQNADSKTAAGAARFKSAQELEQHFDRLKMQALAEYVSDGKKPDAEHAYLMLFNAVIDHDLFGDYEKQADQYLRERPDGAVRPLAASIKATALAGRAEFTAATKVFREMLGEIDANNAAFAFSLCETLARPAQRAGNYAAAREFYSALAKKFASDPEIRGQAEMNLRRLDLAGKPAPAVDAADLDGKKLSLADYRGKVTLIDFWATWCGPCVAEMPNVRAVYDKYHGQGFDVLGVSLDEDADAVREFLKQHKHPWRQVLNKPGDDGDITIKYGVDAIPATFLLDGSGNIQRIDLRGEDLEPAVKALIDKKPVKP